MANNRMWLKCIRCKPTKENLQNDRVLIAKYYPSTGWYFFMGSARSTKLSSLDLEDPEKLNNQLKADAQDMIDKEEQYNKFFEDHDHGGYNTNWGGTNFVIEYETEEEQT